MPHFAISTFPILNFNTCPLKAFVHWVESTGAAAPWWFVAIFLVSSLLMIWRLEALSADGFEGTVLGTLVMPYCSGLGNLAFAFLLGASRDNGADVLTNALVNNVTNLTLVLGLVALLWGMNLMPASKGKKTKPANQTHEINRLSLLLTIAAAMFFTGVLWATARDGRLDFNDGLILIGVFLFWQCFHVFEVLKTNVRSGRSFGLKLIFEILLLGIGAFGIYVSTDWLVNWVEHRGGFVSAHLGWLSGWLMVLPNALIAFYYGWKGRPEVVYSSQVGDGHVSIPLSVGVVALFQSIKVSHFYLASLWLLFIAALVHFLCVAFGARLPRWMGAFLVLAYLIFLLAGLGGK